MSILIYLDQNVLSDLRQRKIDETENTIFSLIKLALKSDQVVVVYSHVTLNEILQIPKEEYREEHIELLYELKAKYIEPISKKIRDVPPHEIWSEYRENLISDEKMGTSFLIDINSILSKKISGLPMDDSFENINEKLKSGLSKVMENCLNALESININDLSDTEKEYFYNASHALNELKERGEKLEPFPTVIGQNLGPKVFREIPQIKSLEIEKMPCHEVVKAIETAFKIENSDLELADFFDGTPQSSVSRAYTLMNWAGYYADDFDKIKKKRDRFNASSNDMQHAVSAIDVNFLLSNDENFLKKAKACYAYIGSSTLVCTPNDFLEKYCKIQDSV
jgi:hypothetical protein